MNNTNALTEVEASVLRLATDYGRDIPKEIFSMMCDKYRVSPRAFYAREFIIGGAGVCNVSESARTALALYESGKEGKKANERHFVKKTESSHRAE